MDVAPTSRLTLAGMAREPFRLFFLAAVLAGMLGALLWPLHLLGVAPIYPGAGHARLMAQGFFGGFIVGFLATALPRLLSAPGFRAGEVFLFLGLHLAMIVADTVGQTRWADLLFLGLLGAFAACAIPRFCKRQDLPPPGFILVPLAWACAVAGTLLALGRDRFDEGHWAPLLVPLLSYQGFVLLPILGVSGFLLPRFFGVPSAQNFPTSRSAPPGWWPRALAALGVGLLVVASFFLEALGHARWGHALRLGLSAAWLLWEVPMFHRGIHHNVLTRALQAAVVFLLAGFLSEILFPQFRVAMLHLSLMGGCALITLTVATRVVYGHSGRQRLLAGRNRWYTTFCVLALIAMATRMSGDFWPAIMKSHYIYGAAIWVVALLLWSWRVLRYVRQPDPEGD